MERMILNGPDFCAVTEDGRLAEFFPKDETEQSGDILLGRIDRMMPGMNCSFADIGRKKNGFLPMEEDSRTFQGKTFRSGETMILQIRKEEKGDKGAFLTRDITLPGTLLILMPMNRYIGVSSRIEDEGERSRLKAIGLETSGGQFGLVMRHSASKASRDEIQEEAESLLNRWKEITEKAAGESRPGTVLFHGGIISQLKNDFRITDPEHVTECSELSAELKQQLSLASARKIRLPGGGNIVFDRCEAMTVIDVNTASASSGLSKEQTILETNLEACRMIADQVRLRNLNGIIVIDFIDMESETDRSLVSERLKQCFTADRIKTVIHGWTRLGLMEMTRKRSRPGLDEIHRTSAVKYEKEKERGHKTNEQN